MPPYIYIYIYYVYIKNGIKTQHIFKGIYNVHNITSEVPWFEEMAFTVVSWWLQLWFPIQVVFPRERKSND